jgi:hypothetical protein
MTKLDPLPSDDWYSSMNCPYWILSPPMWNVSAFTGTRVYCRSRGYYKVDREITSWEQVGDVLAKVY